MMMTRMLLMMLNVSKLDACVVWSVSDWRVKERRTDTTRGAFLTVSLYLSYPFLEWKESFTTGHNDANQNTKTLSLNQSPMSITIDLIIGRMSRKKKTDLMWERGNFTIDQNINRRRGRSRTSFELCSDCDLRRTRIFLFLGMMIWVDEVWLRG